MDYAGDMDHSCGKSAFYVSTYSRSIRWLTSSVESASDVASTLLRQVEHGMSEGENTSYDLIALSTHGRAGLDRWVMGSVTDRLLNTTKLPMLIVRPPKEG